MYIDIDLYVQTLIYIHTSIQPYTYTPIHIYNYTCTYTPTHTHIHTHLIDIRMPSRPAWAACQGGLPGRFAWAAWGVALGVPIWAACLGRHAWGSFIVFLNRMGPTPCAFPQFQHVQQMPIYGARAWSGPNTWNSNSGAKHAEFQQFRQCRPMPPDN